MSEKTFEFLKRADEDTPEGNELLVAMAMIALMGEYEDVTREQNLTDAEFRQMCTDGIIQMIAVVSLTDRHLGERMVRGLRAGQASNWAMLDKLRAVYAEDEATAAEPAIA